MDERKKRTNLNKEIIEFIESHPQSIYTKGIRLQQVWERIAGVQELEHTDNIVRGTGKKGIIIVYVDSSHWAAELSTKCELYRIMLENEIKEEIKELKFLVTRKTALKKTFQKISKLKEEEDTKNKPIKLNLEEDRHARELVVEVENKELQKGLCSLFQSTPRSRYKVP